jgi:hypothetical protein
VEFRDLKLNRSLAACAVVGVLLAGCGGRDGDASPAGEPMGASSTSPTSAAGSASTASTGSASASDAAHPAAGETVSVKSFVGDLQEGNSSITSSHARMTMEIMGQRIVSEGDVAHSAKHPEAIMTMTIPQMGKTEIRLIDHIFYMRMPSMTKDKFMVIDLDKAPQDIAQSLDALDPSGQVDQFAGAIRAVTYLGATQRSGVDVDHYRVRMDSTKIGSLAGGATLPKIIVMELYLDDEHRMRGMQMEVPVQGKKFAMDATFSEFGKDVDVQKPPASQLMANG